jgi:carbonic anhydrase
MEVPSMTADDALRELAEGNRRFAAGRPAGPRRDSARRAELASGQHPFAAVLACSDSRVAPEIIFDQGLGDLFIVRVPGNVADDTILASLELGATHLGVPLIVVLGHTKCGAIAAALDAREAEEKRRLITRLLQPAIDASIRDETDPGKIQDRAARENVRLVVETLRRSAPTLAALQERGALRVVGAVYDIETGLVDWVKG